MSRSIALLLASCLAAPGVFAADFHGFQLDEHLLDASQQAAFAGAPADSVAAQLKIVDDVALPPAVLESMRKTRIVVDPELRGQPGIFSIRNGEGVVTIQPHAFPANKPILLHELLHAYHYNVLTMRNSDIRTAYERAKDSQLFPPAWQSSHFLANAKEYFAVTGTIYLFGDIQQPPFRCTELAKLGEEYLAFLASQFGPHACKDQAVAGR